MELWRIFQGYGLSRTPSQECAARMQKAKVVEIHGEFGKQILWTLRGLMEIEGWVWEIEVVDAKNLGTLHFDGQVFKIANKWFTWRVHMNGHIAKSTHGDVHPQRTCSLVIMLCTSFSTT
jgi:hypothetical protein